MYSTILYEEPIFSNSQLCSDKQCNKTLINPMNHIKTHPNNNVKHFKRDIEHILNKENQPIL